MKSLINKKNGITLIEAILYIGFLSFLMVGFMRFAFDAAFTSMKFSDKIDQFYENKQ